MKDSFAKLVASGDFESALAEARLACSRQPDNAEMQCQLGLGHLLCGDAEAAAAVFSVLLEKQPADDRVLGHLGVALHRLGRHEEAAEHLDRALQLKPGHAQTRYNRACVALDTGELTLATDLLRALVAEQPGNAEWLCAYADALRLSGHWQQALAGYRRVMALAPAHAPAWQNASVIAMHLGLPEEALSMCQKAIELQPDRAQLHQNLGDCLLQLERIDDAMLAYADAYDADSAKADLCVAIGRVWKEVGESAEALGWCEKALAIDPQEWAALALKASLLAQEGVTEGAIALLSPAVEAHPDNVPLQLALSECLWENGDAQQALECLEAVRRLQPERLSALTAMAAIYSASGDTARAESLYREALALNPDFAPALHGLAMSKKASLESQHVERLSALLQSGGRLRQGVRASLASGLAHYCDAVGNTSSAAAYGREANELQWSHRSRRDWQYDPARQEDYVSAVMAVFDEDYFRQFGNLGVDTDLPVFIVGMPRSGTTLTEQILSRHSKVLGVGERPFAAQSLAAFVGGRLGMNNIDTYRSRLAPEAIGDLARQYLARLDSLRQHAGKPCADFVVDKMPDNYALVGWLLTLFPGARIIHATRDVRDVALSCWMTQFASLPWACDPAHIVHRIQQYQRIMAHWQRVLGADRIYQSPYEQLVANQAQETRRLLSWLGLSWEPDCLSFYESDRLVRTASITQVRQPIYTQSVAKWARYREYLPELIEPLMALS